MEASSFTGQSRQSHSPHTSGLGLHRVVPSVAPHGHRKGHVLLTVADHIRDGPLRISLRAVVERRSGRVYEPTPE